jgi:predicted DNA-binding ribbon-helix-helix protein
MNDLPNYFPKTLRKHIVEDQKIQQHTMIQACASYRTFIGNFSGAMNTRVTEWLKTSFNATKMIEDIQNVKDDMQNYFIRGARILSKIQNRGGQEVNKENPNLITHDMLS